MHTSRATDWATIRTTRAKAAIDGTRTRHVAAHRCGLKTNTNNSTARGVAPRSKILLLSDSWVIVCICAGESAERGGGGGWRKVSAHKEIRVALKCPHPSASAICRQSAAALTARCEAPRREYRCLCPRGGRTHARCPPGPAAPPPAPLGHESARRTRLLFEPDQAWVTGYKRWNQSGQTRRPQ